MELVKERWSELTKNERAKRANATFLRNLLLAIATGTLHESSLSV